MNKADESKTEPDSNTEVKTEVTNIPTANVGPARVSFSDFFRGSYMWLVALACFITAIAVAWYSMPEQGIKINIHFPEGHGLQAEDAVRFRGIDVGVVEEVALNSELSGVDVTVNLLPFAEPLARDGSRFWIVRPELSLGSGVSGLETAVGHKYIGLIPGDPEAIWKSSFDGLPSAPADALENPGVEIILRGEKRHSVTAGSPVSFRGVVVGRILSVGLSQDGRYVDVRARIFDKFTKLVTSKTKFWPSSGLDFSGSLTQGVNFQMESLETLARGGVAMLTIENGGQPIKPGDDFVLHPEAEKDWYKKAEAVQATDEKYRRGALPMEVVYTHDGYLSNSEKKFGFVGVHVSDGSAKVLMPSDLMTLPKKGIEGSLKIGLAGVVDSQVGPVETAENLAIVELPGISTFTSSNPLSGNDFRKPLQKESCLAIRANGELKQLTYIHYPIEENEIADDWSLKNFSGDRNVWHGAPVLSERDGRLIGVLVIQDKKAWVEMLPDSLAK